MTSETWSEWQCSTEILAGYTRYQHSESLFVSRTDQVWRGKQRLGPGDEQIRAAALAGAASPTAVALEAAKGAGDRA